MCPIAAKRAAHGTTVHGTSDVVALFDTPDVIGVERELDIDSRPRYGDNGREALCRQDAHLKAGCMEKC